MKTLTVLLLGTVGDRVIEKIAAIDPALRVVDARGKFEVEYAQTWPPETVRRYVPQTLITQNTSTRTERDALLAKAVGMRVLATRRSATTAQRQAQGVDELLPPSALPAMLEQSDFVVVSAQWTPETDKLIGESELQRMKSSTYLINVARGELIDQQALIRELQKSGIAGAALDVYEGEFAGPPPAELWQLPNVL